MNPTPSSFRKDEFHEFLFCKNSVILAAGFLFTVEMGTIIVRNKHPFGDFL